MIPVTVELAPDSSGLRVRIVRGEGMLLDPCGSAAFYAAFSDSFAVGFDEFGRICDVDSHSDATHGRHEKFTAEFDHRLHALTLVDPLRGDSDTVNISSQEPLFDADLDVWWCEAAAGAHAVKIGANFYALLDGARENLCGFAVTR